MSIIFKCIAGSRMFGVHNQFSDYDYKSIVLLPLGDRKKKQPKSASHTIISPEDGGEEVFHFEAFMRLIKEGQTIPFEMLFCPQDCIVSSSPLWDKLVANRDRLIHKNITSFYGFAYQQAMKYSEKGNRIQAYLAFKEFLESKPESSRLRDYDDEVRKFIDNSIQVSYRGHKLISYSERESLIGLERFVNVCETKFGYNHKVKDQLRIVNDKLKVYGKRSLEAFKNDSMDYKALSHCVRVAIEAKELLTDHKITLPLKDKDRDLVLSIKEGRMPKDQILELVNSELKGLSSYEEKSSLREKADEEFINSLIEDYREGRL